MPKLDPIALLKPRRKITGMSAILLPFNEGNEVDWIGFEKHVIRTYLAGLVPAVNMDTGYANLIDEYTRIEVLRRTQAIAAGRKYVAGVFVRDKTGATYDADPYLCGIGQIHDYGGLPIFFQSFGLSELPDDELIEAYRSLASECDEFLFFELGKMFAPFGKIYSLEVYEELMKLPSASGAKHSSLNRILEWQRLELRDRIRPDFKVLTGNDLAIDMVMYGSDYLLGLSTFAPDAFALRDQMWEAGDPRFYELNDLLQYLGTFAFREPTTAYKHSAAMFLHLRDMIATNLAHPECVTRPDSDIPILSAVAAELQRLIVEAQ